MIQTLLIIFAVTLFASAAYSLGVLFGGKRQHTRLRIITEGIVCVILLTLITLVLYITYGLSGVDGFAAGYLVGFIVIWVYYAPLAVIALGLVFFAFAGYSIFLLGASLARVMKLLKIDTRLRYLLHSLPLLLALKMSLEYLSGIGFENIYTDEASGVLARVEMTGIKLNIPPLAGLEARLKKGRRLMAQDETGELDGWTQDIVKATRFNRVQLKSLRIPARPEEDICFSKTGTNPDICSGALPNKAMSLAGRKIARGGRDGKSIRRQKDRSRRVEIDGRIYLYNNKKITPLEPLKIGKSTAYFECTWWDRDLVLENCLSKNNDTATCEKRYEDNNPRPGCRGYLKLRPELYSPFGLVDKASLGEGEYEKALRLAVQELTERVTDFESFVSTYGVEIGSPEED